MYENALWRVDFDKTIFPPKALIFVLLTTRYNLVFSSTSPHVVYTTAGTCTHCSLGLCLYSDVFKTNSECVTVVALPLSWYF